MKILNVGSLNIDHVYQVASIATPGETIASTDYRQFAGGKGANQSAALALAGAKIYHAGRVGPEGMWLVEKLGELGVHTGHVMKSPDPTGHAIIQVDRKGENAIVLYPGANHRLRRGGLDKTFAKFSAGDILLLQNETNNVAYLIRKGQKRGLSVVLNPAPFTKDVLKYPLKLLHTLVVNETEAQGLTGESGEKKMLAALAKIAPQTDIVLTLGAKGAIHHARGVSTRVAAVRAKVVDTTAAGDTFLGYYLAGFAEGLSVQKRMTLAAKAAARCVSRKGAMDAIPARADVDG